MRTRPLLALSLLLLALAAPAAAHASSGDGAIVYAKSIFENGVGEGGLFALGPAGTRQLTSDPADREPAVSPDGRTVAFVREGEIFTLELEGSAAAVQRTFGSFRDSDPIFSPDGSSILFERYEGPWPAHKLYILDLSGGVARALAATPANVDQVEPTFSPDGKLIAFVGRRIGSQPGQILGADIYSIRPTGTDLVALTSTAAFESRPHYSVAGIVFTRTSRKARERVFTMRRNGSGVRLVLPERGAAAVDVSPDGSRLLYKRGSRLWLKDLRSLPRRASGGRALGMGTGWGEPIFSPSGHQVAGVTMFQESWMMWEIGVAKGSAWHSIAGLPSEEGSMDGSLGTVFAWQPIP